MDTNIKEIMRQSFYDSFYIDRYAKKDNYQYLDALVDFVLSKEKSNDYEYIANRVWELDSRIKNIFQFNFEIVSIFFDKINIGEVSEKRLLKAPDITDIKKIVRCSKDITIFLKRINAALLFINWDNLDLQYKKNYVNAVVEQLNSVYGLKIKKNIIYKVKVFNENARENIAVNEMICWLANRFNFTFSHQTPVAIEMLEEYEKIEMYYEIGSGLIENRRLDECNEKLNEILRNIIRPFALKYTNNNDDFLINLSSNELELANAYMYIQDEFCRYIHDTLQEKLQLSAELEKFQAVVENKQIEVEELNKNIDLLQHQISKLHREKDRDLCQLQNQVHRMQNELISLRKCVFDKQNNENILESGKKAEYKGNYNKVAIIGGHIKWQKKVIEQLKGVNVISTDQNVIDWSFLSHIKIVVIVTNYISHSMYYQVINRTTDQELLYLNYKSIDYLKDKLNSILAVKDNKKE